MHAIVRNYCTHALWTWAFAEAVSTPPTGVQHKGVTE